MSDTVLHLGYCCWAACAKDPGFTPDLILDQLKRNARITPDIIALENLNQNLDLTSIKKRWMTAIAEAKEIVAQLDPSLLGCVFVDSNGELEKIRSKSSRAHFGSVKGSWPVVA